MADLSTARLQDRQRGRTLRILHVAPYCAEAWAYGGIPRLVGSLTRGLARRGHRVTLCTTDVCDESSRLQKREEMRSGTRGRWPATRTADGVDLRVFPNVSNHLAYHLQLFLPIGLNKYLSEHARDFDVAHLHACRNVPGAIAAYHLRAAGVPYVLAPNGTAPRIERRRLAKLAFDAVAGRKVFGAASRLLAVSRVEQRQLEDAGAPPDVVRLVPNPVDLEEFLPPPERGRFRRRNGLADSAPLVLFLGKLTPRKRVDVLVRAFAELGRPDARLAIVGNDMGAAAQLRRLVRSLNLTDRTVMIGLLRGRDRLEALADADVVVYPSQHEIFGLVPLEALLCGTPVIVADDSGCGEVVARIGGGRIVPCGRVDALARALREILEAPPQSTVELAASRIRSTFGDDVVCEQLEGVYFEMAAAP
jgi:glycosyltransferase involved in cell wall biosynthesis